MSEIQKVAGIDQLEEIHNDLKEKVVLGEIVRVCVRKEDYLGHELEIF